MMKYYRHTNGKVFAFENDGSQDHLITVEMTLMTEQEVEDHINAFDFQHVLNTYRDQNIESSVTFDNGDSQYNVLNDELTRSRLLGRINYLMLIDPSEMTEWETLDGYDNVTVADMHGIYKECSIHLQNCFSAAKIVEDAHAITPYTTSQQVHDAFDTALGGL